MGRSTSIRPLQASSGVQKFDEGGNLISDFPPQAEFDPGSVGDEMLPDDLALQATLTTLGEEETNAKVYIYSIDDKGKDAYLYTCLPSEFAAAGLDEIMRRYGGGDYRVRVLNGGRVLTHRRISIKEPKHPAPETLAANGIGELARVMQQGFETMLKVMTTQQPVAPPQPSRMEMLQEMQIMSELFRQPAVPQASPFEMVKEVMGLVRDMTPPMAADGSTDPMGVLFKALEMFGKPLAEGMAAAQAAHAHAPTPRAIPQFTMQPVPQAPAPAPAPVVTQPDQSEDEMQFFVKQAINHVLNAAKQNASAVDVAEMVMDQAPQALLNELCDDPAWFEKLVEMNSEIGNHRPWFETMRSHIVAELTEGEEKSNTAGNPNPGGTHESVSST